MNINYAYFKETVNRTNRVISEECNPVNNIHYLINTVSGISVPIQWYRGIPVITRENIAMLMNVIAPEVFDTFDRNCHLLNNGIDYFRIGSGTYDMYEYTDPATGELTYIKNKPTDKSDSFIYGCDRGIILTDSGMVKLLPHIHSPYVGKIVIK